MQKCPFCDKELIEYDKDVVQELGDKLSKSYNNQLICFFPHISSYCPNCAMPEIKEEQINKVLPKKDDFMDIINQEIDDVDSHCLARQAECRAYASELNDDIVGATLNYKACLDIMEKRLRDYEDKHVREFKSSNDKVLLDEDLQQYADAKIYCDTMRELVISTSAKSFEKLGYLGILIYLDTITTTKNFAVADKVFALLNDSTTKVPDILHQAKEQIENRYIKIRKESIRK